jgi:hypothetical protein
MNCEAKRRLNSLSLRVALGMTLRAGGVSTMMAPCKLQAEAAGPHLVPARRHELTETETAGSHAKPCGTDFAAAATIMVTQW